MLQKIVSGFCIFSFLIPIMMISHLYAEAPIPNRDKMLADLDIIKNTFEVKYAPTEWKRTFTQWDLEEQVSIAKTKVLDADVLNLKDFQHILQEFFNATKDYHVGVQFFSTEMAFLPFRIQSAPVQHLEENQINERKYYIAWVYHPFFELFFEEPLKKGDEVLFFNGEPIDAVVQTLQQLEFGNPESQTDQALAESSVTSRLGSKGHRVPQGPVTLTVRRAGTRQVVTYQMDWFYQEEEITGSLTPLLAAEQAKLLAIEGKSNAESFGKKKAPLGTLPFFYKDMTTPFFQDYKEGVEKSKQLLAQKMNQAKSVKEVEAEEEEDEWDAFIGAEKSFIPDLGKVLWRPKADNPFHAYLYLATDGKKVGYIRIPHYMGGDYFAEKFAEIIDYFEKNSAGLVIDQVNNPGGSLFYMYALASMLSDKPLTVLKHKETLTQEDVLSAIVMVQDLAEVTTDEEATALIGETIGGYPVDYQLAQSILGYSRSLIAQWNSGKAISDPAPLYGIDALRPHPKARYTKPILVVVNMLDFSCADFLPAILQDNGRATILGTRTAGAGGYVLQHSYPNRFGIMGYSFTASIAERMDLNPLENLGVTPDHWVDLTVKDLEFGYREFVIQIRRAVSDMLKK